jgi:hypothetical protein
MSGELFEDHPIQTFKDEEEIENNVEDRKSIENDTFNEETPEKNSDIEQFKKCFQCLTCSSVYTTQRSLSRHKETVHDGVRYPCDQCEYQDTLEFSQGSSKR